ncbi:MAG TPA: phosphodiesterase, partial [Actinomycetota bacterium]|nr:phosphodiesterase [Actinomycetota bacterium]
AFTDLSHHPRGAHHPDGIVVVKGAEVASRGDLEASVLDVTPTLLHLAGAKVPAGLDGRVIESAFRPGARPVETIDAVDAATRDESSPYSPEEEALIEESLRGLGYL